MNTKEISEWRGWIWIAIFITVTMVGAAFNILERAEAHSNNAVECLRREVLDDLSYIREDLRIIRNDIKQIILNNSKQINSLAD